MLDASKGLQLFFKMLNLHTHDVIGLVQHGLNIGINLFFIKLVLMLQISEANLH